MVERVFATFGRQRGARTRIAALALAAFALLVFTQPAEAVFVAPYGIEETLITVTTDSDASNGIVSTVEELLADPGPDGISLREAIEATNNDPGRYAIRFTPALKGATIRVGSSTPPSELPPLTGGGVLIDGDIDGDSRPDVTLLSDGPRILTSALAISSSDNQLRALAIQGFLAGVDFLACVGGDRPPSFQTYAGNVVSGLVLRNDQGIWFAPTNNYPECQVQACETHNSWLDTQFVGNTIEARAGGINLQLNFSIGDRVERLTIAGNTIRVISRKPYRFGIGFSAGAGMGSRGNRISDVLVADNSISGNPLRAISAVSAWGDAKENTVERVRIAGNRVHLAPADSRPDGLLDGIALLTGDGGDPGHYPDDNVISIFLVGGVGGGPFPATGNAVFNVDLLGNRLVRAAVIVPAQTELRPAGITVAGGLLRARGNSVACVRLANNQVAGPRGVSVVANAGGASRNTASLGGC